MAHYNILRFGFLCLMFSAISFIALAHEVRPAYLHIEQSGDNNYRVFWKVPRLGDAVLKIQPVFPANYQLEPQGAPRPVAGAMLYVYRLTGNQSLEGQSVYINDLEKTMVDVLVNVGYNNGEKATLMLKPDHNTGIIPGKTDRMNVIKTYTVLGIEHIWFGFDHLLFVLALIIITKGFARVIKTITAFTVAHSITLSLAVLGFVHFPTPPVEAVIALSIVFLAVEMIKIADGKVSLTSRKPWLVAFTFGLLHGFGFAGALADVGLPQMEIPMALAFFNVGVELGQIAFVVVASVALLFISYKKDWPPLLKKAPGYAIGSLAAFWMIERIAAFWI